MKLFSSLIPVQDGAQVAPAAPPAAGSAAPQNGAPPQQPQGGLLSMMVPLLLMFGVMYFLMIRPQRKQQQEKDRMLSNLKKNDHVLTGAGIHGIVKQVKTEDQEVILCIDEKKDVCIRVTKSSIAGLVKPSGSAESEARSEEAAKKA
jgi:preprotein translocase subunit YajC